MKTLSLFMSVLLFLSACSSDSSSPSDNRVVFSLDDNAIGVIGTVNNTVNMTVVSNDANDLRAEYRAGFVQGKLQGRLIISARDNAWDNAYHTDPSHSFPKQPGLTTAELIHAQGILISNYNAFLRYLNSPEKDRTT